MPSAGFRCEPPAANGCLEPGPDGEPAPLPAAGECAALCGVDGPLPGPSLPPVEAMLAGCGACAAGGGGIHGGSGLLLPGLPSLDRRTAKLPVACTATAGRGMLRSAHISCSHHIGMCAEHQNCTVHPSSKSARRSDVCPQVIGCTAKLQGGPLGFTHEEWAVGVVCLLAASRRCRPKAAAQDHQGSTWTKQPGECQAKEMFASGHLSREGETE